MALILSILIFFGSAASASNFGADEVFQNADGTTTLERPFLKYYGSVYSFTESSEVSYCPYDGDKAGILKGICKRAGFTKVIYSTLRMPDDSDPFDKYGQRYGADFGSDGSLRNICPTKFFIYNIVCK